MYVMNKNVSHNGKDYPAGSEIKPGDEGFKELLKAGHVNEGKGAVAQAAVEDAPEQAPAEESESEESEDKGRKGRRR